MGWSSTLARGLAAFRRHGIRGMPRLILLNVAHTFGALSGSGRRRRRADLAFDQLHGTDTAGVRDIGSLGPGDGPAAHAVQYQATQSTVVDALLARLSIDVPATAFVDYGSGKGRVLLVAATRPFKSVTGIELFEELHRVALKNIAVFTPQIRAATVTSLRVDATAFDPPDDPLVAFFYNPFDATILERVASRLEASLRRHPRPLHVLYVDPRHREVFDRATFLEVLVDDGGSVIYRARST